MTPLYLPITPADLSRRIAAHWSGERGVARCAGVDPGVTSVGAKELALGGGFGLHWYCPGPLGGIPGAGIHAALRFLLDALEDAGLAVDRESGRVLGWAAVMSGGPRRVAGVLLTHSRLVSVVDLDITDPRRSAYFEGVLAARLARRTPVGVDAKREGALRRGAAAYRGGGR